jgi:alpha 1,2-mannosyltransferase
MCRFYSGGIFRLDVMQDYDWYWRVDTDSYILEPLATDPFATMSSNDLAYGYMALGREDEHLTTGLWDTTMEWANKQHVGRTALLDQFAPNGQWDRSYYYTNFELVNLKFFRSNQYLDYFDHLDRDTGGFYNHRWGDAPIRLLGVSMLAPKERVHHFNDIAYSHKVYVHVVCDRQKFSDCKKKRKSKKSKS